jgi:mycothiol system anti-sigma-R factor
MMARATAPSPCRTLSPAVDTYLDGELDPCQVVEVEAHLSQCSHCSERVALSRAVRSSLRRVSTAPAPCSLRDKVKARMAAEREAQRALSESSAPLAPIVQLPVSTRARTASSVVAEPATRQAAPTEPTREDDQATNAPVPSSQRRWTRPSGPLRARYALPFAVAAGVAFAISVRRPPSQLDAARGAMASSATEATLASQAPTMGLDGILDDLVSLHAQPLPPEVTLQDDVRSFDPFVGVPVEPPKLQPFGAKWVGGRMLPLHNSRAAALQYSIAGGHRITVYVYDPRRVKQESRQLQSRMVRNAPVFVGNVRGYNVAATERRGVGYALATDLNERESLELVAASAP